MVEVEQRWLELGCFELTSILEECTPLGVYRWVDDVGFDVEEIVDIG